MYSAYDDTAYSEQLLKIDEFRIKVRKLKFSLNKITNHRMGTITTVESIVWAMGVFLKAMTVFMQSMV